MSVLREITKLSPDAAAALQWEGFVSDTDIRSLTRQDLYELIPGPQNIRMRKTICDIIQNVKPINANVLRELLNFIPDDYKAALTKNCFLDDYQVILRDMETKVESVNSFLKAHIGLFEEYAEMQQKTQPANSSVDFETRCAPLVKSQFHGQAQPASSSVDFETRCAPLVKSQFHGQGSVAAQRTVSVQVIVKGETFNCHSTLLQRMRQLGGLHVDETDSGPKVVIVFCPVKTRHMTDIEAAMKDVVTGGAAVILVVMHHTHNVDYIAASLGADCRWDFVNVLYHETVPGLLTCASNVQAVAQLHGMLLKHSSVVSPVVSPVAVSKSVAVRLHVNVTGETLDCHNTLLERVWQLGGLHKTDSGPRVVIFFCPLKTCHMTDIEALLKDVIPGGAAVILVVMHHTQDVNYPNIVQSLGTVGSDRGWDFVNVLYHETVPGLLTCAFNEQAVAQLRDTLLKHSPVVANQCVLL